MKNLTVILCAILLCAFAATAQAADKLQHVVCMKFKSTTTSQELKKVEDAFRALKEKISQVEALEWGTNVSKENKDKGFTHCFVLSFKSEKDLETYVEHAEHKAFVKIVGPVIDDVFVIDFWAKK
jgi:vacuolar-type H+-ATPase subunit I/STV1